MTVTLTDVPKWVVSLVAGPWPEGDEDAMRRLGHAWTELGEVISHVAGLTGTARKHALAAIEGETGKALAAHGIELDGDLNSAAKACHSLGQQLIRNALSTELTKYIIKGSLLALGIQLAADLLVPGVGEADGAAATAATRLTVRAAFRQLIESAGTDAAKAAAGRFIKTILFKGVTLGAIQGGGVPFVAETVQMAQGHRGWGDYDDQIEIGLAAGAAGGLVGEIVGGKVMNGLERTLSKEGTRTIGFLGRTTTRILGGAAGGGAGAVAGEAAQVPFTHQFKLDWAHLLPGLVGGAVGTLPHALRGPASNEVPSTQPKTDESTGGAKSGGGKSGDAKSGGGKSGGVKSAGGRNQGSGKTGGGKPGGVRQDSGGTSGSGSDAGDPAARQRVYTDAARGMRSVADRGAGDIRALQDRMQQYQDGLPVRAMSEGAPPAAHESVREASAEDGDGADTARTPTQPGAGGRRPAAEGPAGAFRALLGNRMRGMGEPRAEVPDDGAAPNVEATPEAEASTPHGTAPGDGNGTGQGDEQRAVPGNEQAAPAVDAPGPDGNPAGQHVHGPDPSDPYPPEPTSHAPMFEHMAAGLSPGLVDRIVGEHPGFFDEPRSLADIYGLVGPDTPFHDLLALRAESYYRNGYDTPPSLSRENLDNFLREIWDDRDDIYNSNDVYGLYASASAANRFSDPGGYIRDLERIVEDRPPDMQMGLIQGHAPAILTPDNAGSFGPEDIGFIHYPRSTEAGVDVGSVAQRVYVNPRADAGADLMGAIVREIVDGHADFPGIYSAKIQGPRFARDDGVVIYTTGDDATARVIDWLADYQAENPDAFMWSTPAMTHQALPGVGVGDEPAETMTGSSFGTARARPIFQALDSVRASGGDFSDFRADALRALDRAGVDPRRPYRNR